MSGFILFVAKIAAVIVVGMIGQSICYAAGNKALAKMTFLVQILLCVYIGMQGLTVVHDFFTKTHISLPIAEQKIEGEKTLLDRILLFGMRN